MNEKELLLKDIKFFEEQISLEKINISNFKTECKTKKYCEIRLSFYIKEIKAMKARIDKLN